MNDLVFTIEQSFNRDQVLTAMQQFHTDTEVGLAITIIYEGDVYATSAQHTKDEWLKRELGVSLFITLNEDKVYQQCVMQVTPAVELLLPAEDRHRIRQKFMEYYFLGDFTPDDACTQGVLVGIKAMKEKILKNKQREKRGLLDPTVAVIQTDTPNPVQYQLPLTVYVEDDYYLVDPEKTVFDDGDTITVENYMTGVTLLLKDAEGQSIELLPSYFPDNTTGEVWPPGLTADIEALKEGNTEAVRILIPELDTLLVYIEKYRPALEMGQSDILALLSEINEAQKDDYSTCDLSASLINHDEGDITGDLGKVTVNEKYEMQSLKMKLTNQRNPVIALEDVDITIKEGADRDKEIAIFSFKGIETDETMLELTVEKKDREFLEWYLLGVKPVFKITTTYIEDDDYTTVSSFTINRGDFSGYFLERSEGTAAEERTEGSGKRIPEGDYDMCYTYKSCRAETTRSNADNETWILTNGETDNAGATITRNYVLIHIGNYPWNMVGCLLIGSSHSDFTLDKDYNQEATFELYEEGWVVNAVFDSGTKLTALNNEYKKLINLTKKFDDDCENNKCYELEIDINR